MCLTKKIDVKKKDPTCEDFIVSILTFKFHLRANVEIFDMIFVLGHALENAEFHINKALCAYISELVQRNPALKLF